VAIELADTQAAEHPVTRRSIFSLHAESGKRLAFVMCMRRPINSAVVMCATFGALAVAPNRAAAAVRPQQIFSLVAALDSVASGAPGKSEGRTEVSIDAPDRAPNGRAAGIFSGSSAARTMGARSRARLDSVVAIARAQLGTRYRLGGESPRAFDCSGLVQYVMRALDFSLPRTAREQATVGIPIPTDTAQLRAGDLLLFGRKGKVTHIGIYVGDGRFVHASTAAHRVVERPLLRKPAKGIVPWIGARRLIAMPDDSTLAIAPEPAHQR
jgi:cell wall-associated NlpC family hydrolase